MKKLISTGLTAVLCATAFASFAQNTPKETAMPPMGTAQKDGMGMGMGTGMKMGMGMDAKAMDSNSDGMISKDEFMKHHEMMWGKMKKNSAGTVDMKDMEAMHKEMAGKHKEMMKHEKKHEMKHEMKK